MFRRAYPLEGSSEEARWHSLKLASQAQTAVSRAQTAVSRAKGAALVSVQRSSNRKPGPGSSPPWSLLLCVLACCLSLLLVL